MMKVVLGPEPKSHIRYLRAPRTPAHIRFEHAERGLLHSSQKTKILKSYLFLSNDVLAKRDCKIAVIYEENRLKLRA